MSHQTKTIVYVLFRMNSSGHECGGVYSSFEEADKAANRLLRLGANNQQHYEAFPFALDAETTWECATHDEPTAVHKWYIKNGQVARVAWRNGSIER